MIVPQNRLLLLVVGLLVPLAIVGALVPGGGDLAAGAAGLLTTGFAPTAWNRGSGRLGTRASLSLEPAAGNDAADTRHAIYSPGAVPDEMLTVSPPSPQRP